MAVRVFSDCLVCFFQICLRPISAVGWLWANDEGCLRRRTKSGDFHSRVLYTDSLRWKDVYGFGCNERGSDVIVCSEHRVYGEDRGVSLLPRM